MPEKWREEQRPDGYISWKTLVSWMI